MNDLFEKIFRDALKQNASDIHIVLHTTCSIYFRSSGKRKSVQSLNIDTGNRLINQLKFLSNIDINYKLKPQTGHFYFQYETQEYNLRVSSIPGLHQESLVIRILDNHEPICFDDLFLIKPIQDYLLKLLDKRQGLFLVSGPTGSGKSTTLYTMIDKFLSLDSFHIITLEDPIEIEKPNCLQIQINEAMDINYHSTLKQILRHDPDIIVIGEIRDEITASLALSAALTGHLVFATIHASNCITTLQRLFNLNCDALDMQESLIGILNQTLLYENKLHKTIVIGELLTKLQIKQYLENRTVDYFDYQSCYQCLYDMNIITKKQKDNLEDE